jgi:hypothetical protein
MIIGSSSTPMQIVKLLAFLFYAKTRKHPSGANQLLAMAEQGMAVLSSVGICYHGLKIGLPR